ncbi:MAG: peptidylprolyl isomerase [Aggregatilineales bacterium]
MAQRKRNTTGLPGSTRRDPAVRIKHRTRAQREAETNRLVLLLSAIIAIVIIVVLGAAFVVDGVIRPNQAVATVGGTGISLRDFQQRVIFERWQAGEQLAQVYQISYLQSELADPSTPYGQLYSQMLDPATFGKTVLDKMTNALIVKEYAAKNNITVTDDEVQKQLGQNFGYAPDVPTATATIPLTLTPTDIVSATPSPSPTITPTPSLAPTATLTPFPTGFPTNTPGPTQQAQDFQKNQDNYYQAAAKGTGLSADTIRQLFTEIATEQALSKKVETAVAGKPQAVQDEVKVRHILLKNEDDANAVIKALNAGESFAELAHAVSQDTGSASQGGELGWTPNSGQYVTEFNAYVWDPKTVVGAISAPIHTQDGFHVIQLEARQPRQLSDQDQQAVLNKAYNDWLTKTKTDYNTQTNDTVWTDNVPSTPDLTAFNIPTNLSQGAGSSSGFPPGVIPGQ